MSEITRKSSIEEIAALVSEALRRDGVSAVLTGGAVVSLYSENQYQSWDLDFVIEGLSKKVEPAMKSLGFVREKGRHFIHPRSRYFVEFPAGPLMLGEQCVKEIAERQTIQGMIRLLPPTECVMDRLASFYHWNDAQALDQAIAVASRHPIKLEKIKNWSAQEGMKEKYRVFLKALKKE